MSVLLTGSGPTFSSSATGPVTPGTTSTSSTTASSTTTPDPNLPIQSNLQAWWDSRESASYPGSGTTWYDLTANANDLTLTNNSGADPVFVPGPNYFATGSKGYFQRTSGFTNLPSGNSHFTVSVCCRKTGAWEDASTYQLGQTSDKLGHSGFHRAGTTGNTQSTAFYSYTNNGYMSNPFDWVVLSYVYDGTDFLLIEDTTQLASVSANAFNVNVAGGTLLIGWTNGFTNYEFKGDVLGALIYDKALDNTELQHNYDYFLNPMPPTTSSSSSSSSSTTSSTSTTAAPPIPLTNLLMWQDADDASTLWQDAGKTVPVTSNNDPVVVWEDKSGNNNDLTRSATTVQYKTNALNGLPVVEGSGGGNMDLAVMSSSFERMTTFVVAKMAWTGGYPTIFDFRKGINPIIGQDIWTVLFDATDGYYRYRGPSGTLTQDAIANDSQWHQITMDYDESTVHVWIDGTLVGTQSNTDGNALLQAMYTFANQCQIAEFVHYDAVLSGGDRATVESYLVNKWFGGYTTTSSTSTSTSSTSTSTSSTSTSTSSTSTTTSTTTTIVPTNITNLVNWYDGSDVTTMFKDTAGTQAVTADNDLVARWNDKSGQGNNALQATSGSRPTYKTNIRNSQSVLSYDGGDFLLAGALAATMGMENTTFVVLKQASTGVGMAYVDFRKDDTGNLNDLWLVGADVIYTIGYEIIARDNAGTLDKLGLNTVDTNWHYLTASYDLTELRLQDGTNTPSTLTKAYGSTQLNYARIGGTYAAGSNLDGYLAEVLVYSRKLSASEIGQVQTYLAVKWGF